MRFLQLQPSHGVVILMAVLLGILVFNSQWIPSAKKLPQMTSERQEALNVYHQVWDLVSANYVDATYNEQDWARWRNRYDDVIQSKEDAYVGIETMLLSLNDQYSRLLTPKAANEQEMQIASRLFGIGIQLREHGGKKIVVAAMQDTPAARANILPQDVILKVDGLDIRDMDLEEVVSKIRGPKGTRVLLTIQRGRQLKNIPVIRDEIRIKSVSYKLLPQKIGYLRLATFISQDAIDELTSAIKQARENSKALIIDIRGNTGGLLPNALELADMFLKQGEIVSVVNRMGDKKHYTAHEDIAYDRPLVILIDGGSASASEIFSGAMQDHKRAILVGEKTFGKGLVQRINQLNDGSELNLTVAKYLTPNGVDINKIGISPNVEVPLTREDMMSHRDKALDKAVKILKSQVH